MKKVGIIGLGDIAQKAYLPIITKLPIEIHLLTRNTDTLKKISSQYHISHIHHTIESIITEGIKAAFVHTNTDSHYEIAKVLLENGVHVFVDKPITYTYATAFELSQLALKKRRHLFTGFNRRYAPAYADVKTLSDVNMIAMQKNRKSLPGDIRKFVFDDFIHVVDTLLFLFDDVVTRMIVTHKKSNGLLANLVIQFVSESGKIAIGIMNRDSATVEESLEVFSPAKKVMVRNMTSTSIFTDQNEIRSDPFNWETTLFHRGFPQMIDHFITGLSGESGKILQWPDPLTSHKICEDIITELQKQT